MEPKKVGLAPVQREGLDYEPDLFFDMTAPDNGLVVSKSRSDRIAPGTVFRKPGTDLSDLIIEWIEDSEPPNGARTLGEAVNMAVAEGILAAEEKSAERYKEAKRRLVAWCDLSGVAQIRRDLALGQFKERVALVAGPRAAVPPSSPESPPGPPSRPAAHGTPEPRSIRAVEASAVSFGGVGCAGVGGAFLMNAAIMSDEDRLRAIDQGRA
jgi:hypothetical protein